MRGLIGIRACRPYFGQVGWYTRVAPVKIPGAIERYQKEILRVLGVLDGVLAKTEWLVGDKCSAADLSFLTYVTYSVAFAALHS